MTIKTQKVKFHRGDRRPNNEQPKLSYTKKMVKRGKDIIWQVIEKPTKSIICEYFFEEDAHKLVKFQNKNKVWEPNGGIPKFLHITL
jgi:hypothetical protein|tara:strand:+ start:262 stop:522 length:261 start_codon:yes stop_codon:yes gene_type:complete